MDAGARTRTAKERARPAMHVTLGSVVLAVIKGLGAWATGSTALLASAASLGAVLLLLAGR